MAKSKKKARFKCISKLSKGMDALDIHNAERYLEDYEIINRLSYLPPSKKDWIETTRYELMAKPTLAEMIVGKTLIERKVEFVHQHPFIIEGKIYFADFYIPSKHCIIEVDGWSHDMMTKRDSDATRDSAFEHKGIPTIRIANATCKNPKLLGAMLDAHAIQ